MKAGSLAELLGFGVTHPGGSWCIPRWVRAGAQVRPPRHAFCASSGLKIFGSLLDGVSCSIVHVLRKIG